MIMKSQAAEGPSSSKDLPAVCQEGMHKGAMVIVSRGFMTLHKLHLLACPCTRPAVQRIIQNIASTVSKKQLMRRDCQKREPFPWFMARKQRA